MKICSHCKEEKDYSFFNKNKSNRDGYQFWCNPCRKERYLQDQEEVISRAKTWYKNNREVKQQYDKERRVLYGDTLRQYDRERSSTLSRRVTANHSTAKRRAKKKQATVLWDEELTAFVSREAFSLAKQRERMFGFKWHVDHIIPLSGKEVCGLHVWNNFQVIPAIVNLLKSNHFERNV